ncbi:MAG: HD domain-containing protein [Phycisphaerales bacterium]|nr:HD domain-containing protein [Phycisphaerales bacterium]
MPTAPVSQRRYITQLEPSEYISGLFCISNTQLGRTKNDKPFLKVLVKDKTGEMAGRMWSIDRETYESLPTEGFAFLEGETQAYQGEMQIILRSIAPAEATIDQMRELLPVSQHDPEVMFAGVVGLLNTLEHPAIKALAKVYLEDEALIGMFKQAPAAKSMHHAYIGGLLEHTLNLLRLADKVCPLYPKINRDIVMMGLFLHDLGKTRELVWDRAFSYTDRGELIGHLVEGAIMLHDRAQMVMRTTGIRLPRHALTVLQHIIISHHDKPEFGAAKCPSTPEAILVAMLDNLDAKTFIALAAARPEREAAVGNLGGNFTEKQWALDTKLFKPDPLKE